MTLRLIKRGDEIYRLSTENLDTVTTTGTYHQPQNRDASTVNNYPEGTAGLLEVQDSGHRMGYQRYTCYNSGNVYYRGSYDGQWKAWKRLLTE